MVRPFPSRLPDCSSVDTCLRRYRREERQQSKPDWPEPSGYPLVGPQRAVGAAGAVALRLEFVMATDWSVTARRAEGWGSRPCRGWTHYTAMTRCRRRLSPAGRGGLPLPQTPGARPAGIPPPRFGVAPPHWTRIPRHSPAVTSGQCHPSFLPPQPERYLIRLLVRAGDQYGAGSYQTDPIRA